MYRIYHLYYPGTPVGVSIWILIFGICQIFISMVSSAIPSEAFLLPRCDGKAHIGAASLKACTAACVVSPSCSSRDCGCESRVKTTGSWSATDSAFMLQAQLRNFNSLRGISFSAAVMSLGYSTIAIALT